LRRGRFDEGVPYRTRMTLHTHCTTPAYTAFSADYAHLLTAVEAGRECHARLAAGEH